MKMIKMKRWKLRRVNISKIKGKDFNNISKNKTFTFSKKKILNVYNSDIHDSEGYKNDIKDDYSQKRNMNNNTFIKLESKNLWII